jgi:hypothetical protein
MLLEKIDEIQNEIIIEKYQLPNRESFKKLIEIHNLQQQEGKLGENLKKLFPDLKSLNLSKLIVSSINS